MFHYRRSKKGIPYHEVWFLKDRAELRGVIPRSGIVRLMQSSAPLGFRRTTFHTLLIDLKQGEEALLADMRNSNREKIRKCGKDSLITFAALDNLTPEQLREAALFHNSCAEGTPIPPFNEERIGALVAVGSLNVTRAMRDGEILVQHVHVHDGVRDRLLYSCSPRHALPEMKEKISLANRWLHWQDILWLRTAGFSLFDMGGISSLGEDGVTPGIDRFKREFSKTAVTEYNGLLLNI